MTQAIIPILAFMAVVFVGGAVLLVRGVRRRMLEGRLYGAGAGAGSAVPFPARSAGLVTAMDQVGRAVGSAKPPTGLREKLARAGFYEESAVSVYVGAQLVLSVLGLALGGLAAVLLPLSLLLRACVLIAVVAVLALLPNLFVSMRKRQRTADVRRSLPDAIDLLEICVSSGMGLDLAWNAVSDEIRGVSHVLADEMALVNLEIHLGGARADSLRHMSERTGAEEISSLVATLVQSERFGTSVSQALRVFADALRTERSQRAEEAAEKLMVKLLFPMVLFIFPCMFVVILGPAGIKIADMFSNG